MFLRLQRYGGQSDCVIPKTCDSVAGAEDRLHDNRARDVIEAIMWHGYSKESDAYWCTEKFYNLKKEERDAVVEFVNSI